jgi:hypothetical protein
VVCVGERQTTLAPTSSGHTTYKGNACTNAQTAGLNMQMLRAWVFGLVYVRVGTILLWLEAFGLWAELITSNCIIL